MLAGRDKQRLSMLLNEADNPPEETASSPGYENAHLIRGFLAHPSQPPKRHLDRFSLLAGLKGSRT